MVVLYGSKVWKVEVYLAVDRFVGVKGSIGL